MDELAPVIVKVVATHGLDAAIYIGALSGIRYLWKRRRARLALAKRRAGVTPRPTLRT